MPLGFEVNSAMPSIITDGGKALSQSLVQTGQNIQAGLMRQQAIRQTKDFGAALSQVNPASDDFPQTATYLASQYPLALSSGMGAELLKEPAAAYHAYKQGQLQNSITDRQIRIAGMRRPVDTMVNISASDYNGETPVDSSVRPAPNVSIGTDETTFQNPDEIPDGVAPAPMVGDGETSALMGTTGDLSDNSALIDPATTLARRSSRVSPLERAKSAFAPKEGTIQVPQKTLNSAALKLVAMDTAARMQEDRQAEAEKLQTQRLNERRDAAALKAGAPSGMTDIPGMPGFRANKSGSIIWDFNGDVPVQVGKKIPDAKEAEVNKTYKALKEADDAYKTEVKIVNDLKKAQANEATLAYHLERTKKLESERDALRQTYTGLLGLGQDQGPQAAPSTKQFIWNGSALVPK